MPWEKVKLMRINNIKMDQFLTEELELRQMNQDQGFMEGVILELSIGSIPHTFPSGEHFLSEATDKTYYSLRLLTNVISFV